MDDQPIMEQVTDVLSGAAETTKKVAKRAAKRVKKAAADTEAGKGFTLPEPLNLSAQNHREHALLLAAHSPIGANRSRRLVEARAERRRVKGRRE